MVELPAGRVTFAFTDVVGSTRAFSEFGDEYVERLVELHLVIARATEAHRGAVVKTEGDGAFLAFWTAAEALAAMEDMYSSLEADVEPSRLHLRVRAGAHSGEAVPVNGDYVSLTVHYAARVAATGNAGQVIVSQAVLDELPAGSDAEAVQLGEFELKDLPRPVVLWRLRGDDTPVRATPVRRTNVAKARTSFVGRAEELGLLTDLTSTPGLVTVTGPGGIGKSRLANELALRRSRELTGGAWLAELSAVEHPDQVATAVAAAVGSVADKLGSELAQRGEAILLLDGCEHLVDAVAELVSDLLDRCPELRIICTSREALDVDAERVVRLRPLAAEAHTLFRDRAEAAGMKPGDLDESDVVRVCAQLDGLPLALELAAARVPTMPVKELSDALGAGALQLKRRGGERRHRSLSDLLAWSLRLLPEPERRALLALSLWPGRFSASAAKELLADVPGVAMHPLPELVRRSLIDLDGDRYRLLQTVRDTARLALGEDSELAYAAQRALLRWALNGSPDHTMLASGRDDFDTVLALEAAWAWALDHRAEAPTLGRVARRLRTWSQSNGGHSGLRELASRTLACGPATDADTVTVHAAAADILAGVGDRPHDLDVTLAERLVAEARSVDDVPARFHAIGTAAMIYAKAGLPDRSIPLSAEALDLLESEPGLHHLRGAQLGDTAVAQYFAGDMETAAQMFERAIQACLESGDVRNAGVNRLNLAELMLDRGDPGSALNLLQPALQPGAEVPMTVRVLSLSLLVDAHLALGNVEAARTLAPDADRELSDFVTREPSIVAYLERLRSTLSKLAD